MQVRRLETIEELDQLADQWNCLARGVPFRTWQWLATWWRHYSHLGDLYTLAVFDGSALVGLAPWYRSETLAQGRIVRQLGSGQVCTDYMSVLSSIEHEEAVTGALAEWLTTEALASSCDRWDELELEGVDAEDRAVARLADHLARAGCAVHERPGMPCWRVQLPESWDEYETLRSKSHRKQMRRLLRRVLTAGRAELRTATSMADLHQGMALLVDLHTRRWQARGQGGCFASPCFSAFLHEAAARLFDSGMLLLQWLELDERPVATELSLVGGQVTYGYQTGIDPELLDQQPGNLLLIAILRYAIDQRQKAMDFLRGDEPYKSHWGARPRPSIQLRVAANRPLAQVRHGVWRASAAMKQWIKDGLLLAGLR